jgi:hypothetical protein
MYVVDLLKRMKSKSDLFIESFVHSNPLYYRKEQHDVLNDVIKTNFKQMFAHKGKSTKGVKVHYSDIRSLVSFAPFINVLDYLLFEYNNASINERITVFPNLLTEISWCDTLDKLKQFIDLMLLSDDYIFDVSKLIPKEFVKHFTYKYDLMTNKRKYITRLRKQFLSLTKEHQQLLVRFHEDTCNKLKQKHRQYDIAMKEMVIHYAELPQSRKALQKEPKVAHLNTLAHALLKWGSHVKDIYTIARMLFYLDKSNNIISYDGAAHSKTYATFFKTYMKAKVVHKENHYRKTIFSSTPKFTNGNQFRCVKLPKSIIQEVFDVPV